MQLHWHIDKYTTILHGHYSGVAAARLASIDPTCSLTTHNTYLYSTYIATLCILTTRPFAAERYLETSRLLYIRLLYAIACTRRLCTHTGVSFHNWSLLSRSMLCQMNPILFKSLLQRCVVLLCDDLICNIMKVDNRRLHGNCNWR